MALCKASEGCDRQAKKLNFCNTHYMQVKRGARDLDGHLLRELRKTYVDSDVLCKGTDCKRTPFARGFCNKHYQLFRFNRIDEGGKPTDPSVWKSYYRPDRKRLGTAGPCRLKGCGRQKVHTGLGLCGYHYRRFQLKITDSDGNLLREEYRVRRYTEKDLCLVDDCEKKAKSNHFCAYHVQRFYAGIIDADGNPLRPITQGRPRSEDPRWSRNGYIYVRAPEDHPHANKDGMVSEHRLVMEKVLGRYLVPGEIVHHKDSDRANNDPDNLELRTRRTHPPGGKFTKAHAEKALGHLKSNDLEAYKDLLEKLKKDSN